MKHWYAPLAAAILLPLMLASCLFMPGKFDSTLTIHKDRSFTFTYKGEVMALDLDDAGKGLGDMSGGDAVEENATVVEESATDNATDVTSDETPEQKAADAAAKKAEKDAQYREVAAQLAKEAGYRTIEYRGDGVFYVDYAISGVLGHNFVYPYNLDTMMVFPWVSVELRGKDAVRVKATGFAKQDLSGMGVPSAPGGAKQTSKVNGTFTLTTDAGVVSQNNEDGAETVGSNTVITWHVTPTTPDAPMAVLRVKPLP
jgi:hypothetical protein